MPPQPILPVNGRRLARALAAIIATTIGAACRPTDVGVVPLPSPTPAFVSTAAPVPVSGIPTTELVARPVSLPSDDELARTVVAVFGDSAALQAAVASADADETPSWDIDVRSYETHERVAHYVELFSNGARARFQERLSRGTRYEPMIRAKLRASGMPEDLTYLALIESGYDPNAYSRAAAVGMWQFMTGTARAVGLRVDWWIDERRDPTRSTDGAIRFLTDLQKQFGSLYLAAAAYNGGPGRVARGLSRFAGEMEGSEGEDRFFALAEQDYLRAETKNYVPQIIAAALLAKLPGRYGLAVDSLPPFAYDSVFVDAGTGLAVVADAGGATHESVRALNPAVLRGVSAPDRSSWLRVPVGLGERIGSALAAMPELERVGFHSFVVSGTSASLASLASRNGIEVRQLAAFNPGLKTARRGRLVAGQQVRVPTRATLAFARAVPDPSIERYGGAGPVSLARRGVHVVRRGETLGGIARRYGLTVSRLKSLNGIKANRVVTGQTLRVRSATASRGTKRPLQVASKASSATRQKAKAKLSTTQSRPKSASRKAKSVKKPAKKKGAS